MYTWFCLFSVAPGWLKAWWNGWKWEPENITSENLSFISLLLTACCFPSFCLSSCLWWTNEFLFCCLFMYFLFQFYCFYFFSFFFFSSLFTVFLFFFSAPFCALLKDFLMTTDSHLSYSRNSAIGILERPHSAMKLFCDCLILIFYPKYCFSDNYFLKTKPFRFEVVGRCR